MGIDCYVELVPPHTLPRTSSGKLSRSKARQNFIAAHDLAEVLLGDPEQVRALPRRIHLLRQELQKMRKHVMPLASAVTLLERGGHELVSAELRQVVLPRPAGVIFALTPSITSPSFMRHSPAIGRIRSWAIRRSHRARPW